MSLESELSKLVDKYGLAEVSLTIDKFVRASFYCDDCSFDCWEEYYMLNDEIWNSVAEPDEMLCIQCFEERLGRPLDRTDFNGYPVNTDDRKRTFILMNRLKREPGDKSWPVRNGYAWTADLTPAEVKNIISST